MQVCKREGKHLTVTCIAAQIFPLGLENCLADAEVVNSTVQVQNSYKFLRSRRMLHDKVRSVFCFVL